MMENVHPPIAAISGPSFPFRPLTPFRFGPSQIEVGSPTVRLISAHFGPESPSFKVDFTKITGRGPPNLGHTPSMFGRVPRDVGPKGRAGWVDVRLGVSALAAPGTRTIKRCSGSATVWPGSATWGPGSTKFGRSSIEFGLVRPYSRLGSTDFGVGFCHV